MSYLSSEHPIVLPPMSAGPSFCWDRDEYQSRTAVHKHGFFFVDAAVVPILVCLRLITFDDAMIEEAEAFLEDEAAMLRDEEVD